MNGDLFREHADSLERAGRSPVCVELMRGAAADFDAGGVVARIFAGDAATPGSMPGLRLVAALHQLVLSGRAPELARYYPSAGGCEPAAGVWDVARTTLVAREELVRTLARRTVQTNEPGRCTALYGALLWLSERHGAPIRLLEIGASAGLNLNADRFRYVVGGTVLGDDASPLEFVEPWVGTPVADPAAAAARLRIVERAGCDRAPIDPASPAGRVELQAYIWPDEPERLAGVEQAAQIAARHPVRVDRGSAAQWLAERLAEPRPDVLTVVWQSLVDQYLDDAERAVIRSVVASAGGGPIARLELEPPPSDGEVELRCSERPEGDGSGAARVLATAGYHGPPVVWLDG